MLGGGLPPGLKPLSVRTVRFNSVRFCSFLPFCTEKVCSSQGVLLPVLPWFPNIRGANYSPKRKVEERAESERKVRFKR